MVIFINQIRMKIGVMYGSPGDHHGRQRAEVLRLRPPRHPPHRRDQGPRGGRRQPDPRQGRQEQGRAAVQAGRVRHHVWRGHLQDRRADRPRRQGRHRREVRRLVLLSTASASARAARTPRRSSSRTPRSPRRIEAEIRQAAGIIADKIFDEIDPNDPDVDADVSLSSIERGPGLSGQPFKPLI